MRNNYLAFLIILIAISFGCKKENKISTSPAYHLSYVSISSYDDYDWDSIIPIDSSYTDSILHLSINTGMSMYDAFTQNNDTLLYTGYPFTSSFYNIKSASFQNGRFNESLFEQSDQYATHNSHIRFGYSHAGLLDKFQMESTITQDAYILLIDSSENTLHFTNGDLDQIAATKKYRSNNVYRDTDGYYMDTLIQRNEMIAFNYAAMQNQKEMIGIDVNDLVLNAFLRLYSYNTTIGHTGLIKYSFLEQALLLNGKFTYNTDCDHLINRIEFKLAANGGASSYIYPTVILTINYTFEHSKNDRIQTMEMKSQTIPDFYDGSSTEHLERKYTFHYKDQ